MAETYTNKRKRKKFIGAKFTTTVSIALVLFVIGMMAVGGLAATRLTTELREQFTVIIEMSDCATKDYAEKLAASLEKQVYAKDVTCITADSALAIITEQLGENPESFLDFNPMTASIELQMIAEYATNDSIEPIIKRLKAQGGPNIERIDYDRNLVNVVNEKMRNVVLVFLVVVSLLLLICVSLINNAVRMAMHADRFLINTMQLVGATNWFIRRPFIRQNIICGLVASVLAFAAIVALVWYGISQGVASAVSVSLFRPESIAILVVSIIVPGILIPAIAAWFSAGRYLRHSVDDLYLM